jgi:NhaA family Na+:H+ antiporter
MNDTENRSGSTSPVTPDVAPFDPQQLGPAARLMARLGLAPSADWRQTRLGSVLSPVQEFMHQSAAGGIVLMLATIIALVLANSPLRQGYEDFLHLYLGFTAGSFSLKLSLLHWINDGLMALFFLLVGLEIKREIIVGELSDARAALLPIVAAFGGALVPALIYFLINAGGAGVRGWAVPMATDIAFTLGVVALLGRRVPLSLKIFLTAVAIADDLIAVLVIALFYTNQVNFSALGLAFGVLALLTLCNFLGVRRLGIYLGLGLVVWLAFLQSGVHATIAGVLVAWTIPARIRINPALFVAQAGALLEHFNRNCRPEDQSGPMLTDEHQQSTLAELEELCEGVQSPLQRLEQALHVPVSFVIVPIFALANAGVALSLDGLSGDGGRVAWGIAAGLLIGKPIGLLGASFLVIKSGAASLPAGTTWLHMTGGAVLCGIGFTMSLFVASLGFGESALLGSAKTGILAASLVAGAVGYAILARVKDTKAPLLEEEVAPEHR